ncbi:Peroxin-3-domain-containing protein, partial [Jimgerdemannia flammicorona]
MTERVVSVSTTSPTPSPSASSTLTDSENGHKSNEEPRNGDAAAGSPTSTSSPTTSSPISETPSSRRGDEDMTTSTTSLMASTGSLGAVSTASGENSVLIGTSPSGGTESMVMVEKKSKRPKQHNDLLLPPFSSHTGFTRTLTSLYVLVLITLLTHIQLNLLGRFTYISSVAALNRDEPTIRLEKSGSGSASHSRDVLDFETERRFLGFSWWILHRGWRVVKERVERVVEEAVG